MKYLKIRAKNYNEAMMKLKMEHGDDAIPISHKYVKEGGILNSKLFAKEVVELTAAVQEPGTKQKTAAPKKKIDFTVGGDEKKAGSRLTNVESLSQTIDSLNKNLNSIKDTSSREIMPPETGAAVSSTVKNPVETRDQELARELKKPEGGSVRNFEREFSDIKSTLNKLLSEQGRDHDRSSVCLSDEDVLMKPYDDLLQSNDFDIDERHIIINEVKNGISRDDLGDKFKIEKSLKDLLKSRIITTGPIKMGKNKKKIVMFVGPTGVGKTTTMAKLGAMYSLREGHKVAFITIDNYRIAATEQLKKYAEIMRIPVHAINDQREFKDVIAKEKAEIIMIDTSGRSHRNDLKISEIKTFAEQVEYDFEKILCVSANIKKNDISDIFKSFDTMNFDSIIITKVDETSFIGNVVDIADKYKKPIAYFTNGQEVPNDIVIADPEKIVGMMMGDSGE
ncbi:MAG: flagellar biosynthesis protein FlhF [bacterium]|nr:flagellar biosynthesis protein FlhF [bacterium]